MRSQYRGRRVESAYGRDDPADMTTAVQEDQRNGSGVGVPTPMGAFQALSRCGSWTAGRPDRQTALQRGVSRAEWDIPRVGELSFLRGPVDSRGPGLALTRWGGLWTFRAAARVDPLLLSLVLFDLPAGWSGGHDTGQYLTAASYANEETTVSIGTQDAEAMRMRASGRWDRPLPRQWVPLLQPARRRSGWRRHRSRSTGDSAPIYDSAVTSAQPGLAWRLPPFEPGDTAEIHVLVAWGPNVHQDHIWAAVDATTTEVHDDLVR